MTRWRSWSWRSRPAPPISRWCGWWSTLSPARLDDLKIAVTEACSNAIEAQESNWSEGPVVVRCMIADDEVRVEIIDRGTGFDPDEIATLPAVTDPRRLRHESGLGIALMRTLADEVSFTPSADGTRVSLVVRRPAHPAS
jgi:serine/threonine-protein kinase RsbW